jgi:nicotinate-nucleotide adenylyltransferase
LLTGTFDPVHLGHVAMARAAMGAGGLDEVWFLVNPDPGHKVEVTNFANRLAMARLAVAGVPDLRVYSGDLADKPHDIDVFLTLINAYPRDNFVFIVGVDVFQRMHAWKSYERVVREARFVAARRRGAEVVVDPRLQVTWFDLAKHAGASSRDIREELRAGMRPVDLDGRVYEYVRERGLYGARLH